MLLRYFFAGGVNTLIAFAVYASLVQMTPTPFWLANLLGVLCSIASGLLFGKYLVFRESGAKITAVWWKYFTAYGAQYLLGTGLIGGFIALGATKVAGYIFALPFVVAFGFAAQRFWVFKVKAPKG